MADAGEPGQLSVAALRGPVQQAPNDSPLFRPRQMSTARVRAQATFELFVLTETVDYVSRDGLEPDLPGCAGPVVTVEDDVVAVLGKRRDRRKNPIPANVFDKCRILVGVQRREPMFQQRMGLKERDRDTCERSVHVEGNDSTGG